jgi:hypothetical protein
MLKASVAVAPDASRAITARCSVPASFAATVPVKVSVAGLKRSHPSAATSPGYKICCAEYVIDWVSLKVLAGGAASPDEAGAPTATALVDKIRRLVPYAPTSALGGGSARLCFWQLLKLTHCRPSLATFAARKRTLAQTGVHDPSRLFCKQAPANKLPVLSRVAATASCLPNAKSIAAGISCCNSTNSRSIPLG